MKFALLACLASAMVWAVAHNAQAQGGVEQKIAQLERDWANAMVNGDADGVGRFEAADYVFTGSDGTITGRADDVSDIKSGNFRVASIDFEDLKVHVYGDTAIVTAKVTLKNCKYRGQDLSGQYRITDVWAKAGSGWQAVASQATALPKQ